MALKTYLYEANSAVDPAELQPFLPIGAFVSVGSPSTSSLTAVTVDELDKEDLDEAMAEFGFTFVAEQTDTPAVSRRDYGVRTSVPTEPAPSEGDHFYDSLLEQERYYNGTDFVGYFFASDPLEDFLHDDVSPITVTSLNADAIVEWVKLVITVPFDDAAATIEVGTPATPGAILSAVQSDPGNEAVYITDAPFRTIGATSLRLTISPAASTQGAGYVLARIRQ